MKATAQAPSNIAFIKYWGRKDNELRLPANHSLSVNLEGLSTVTTVEFSGDLAEDGVEINSQVATGKQQSRVVKLIDRVRQMAGVQTKAKVTSYNTFPKGAGLASSASGFAALALASTAALELDLSEKELSQLARLGSGSACRSIPDGFVEWQTAETHEDSFAHSLHPANHWKIVDVIALVDQTEKTISSSEGHEAALKSPFYQTRIQHYLPNQYTRIKDALANRDFTTFGLAMEEEAINFHAIIMTSDPSILYWNAATMTVLHAVRQLRTQGLEAYFTIDAGPNVHIFVEEHNVEALVATLGQIPGIQEILVAPPAQGARLITEQAA